MKAQKFNLTVGSAKRTLILQRKSLFGKMGIFLDQEKLADLASVKELRKGQEFTLQDGSTLVFKMVSNPFPEFQISHNGNPVEGSANDSGTRIRTAYNLMAFICAINFLIGIMAIAIKSKMLLGLGFGPYNLLIGTCFLLCLIFSNSKKRFTPLALGLLIFSLDTVLALYSAFVILHMFPNPGILIVRFFIIWPWWKGVREALKVKPLQDPS